MKPPEYITSSAQNIACPVGLFEILLTKSQRMIQHNTLAGSMDMLVQRFSIPKREFQTDFLVIIAHHANILNHSIKHMRSFHFETSGLLVRVRKMDMQMVETWVVVEMHPHLIRFYPEFFRDFLVAHISNFSQKR